MRTPLRWRAAVTLSLLVLPAASNAQDVLPRPSIVVDAFSFAALLESRLQPPAPRYPAPLPYPRLGRPAPTFPVGGWGVAPLRRVSADERRPSPSSAGEDTQLAQLGQGIADLLVERLLRTGRFRILERRALEAIEREQRLDVIAGGMQAAKLAGARYYVTGSVTRFGTEDQNFLGGGGTRGFLGLLGIRRRRTEVVLVARVVDTRTGEIVASVRGAGESNRGSGFTVGGLGGGAGGIGNVGSSEFRSSALGQATEQAVEMLATELAATAIVPGQDVEQQRR